jgi:hypothetical protein
MGQHDDREREGRGGRARVRPYSHHHDEQSHQELSAPNGRGYVVNVASARNGIGYGAWTHIDGWSENVLRYVVEAERNA